MSHAFKSWLNLSNWMLCNNFTKGTVLVYSYCFQSKQVVFYVNFHSNHVSIYLGFISWHNFGFVLTTINFLK